MRLDVNAFDLWVVALEGDGGWSYWSGLSLCRLEEGLVWRAAESVEVALEALAIQEQQAAKASFGDPYDHVHEPEQLNVPLRPPQLVQQIFFPGDCSLHLDVGYSLLPHLALSVSVLSWLPSVALSLLKEPTNRLGHHSAEQGHYPSPRRH